MDLMEDVPGNTGDLILHQVVTAPDLKYRVLVDFEKNARFIERDPHSAIDPAGSTVHVDQCHMDA